MTNLFSFYLASVLLPDLPLSPGVTSLYDQAPFSKSFHLSPVSHLGANLLNTRIIKVDAQCSYHSVKAVKNQTCNSEFWTSHGLMACSMVLPNTGQQQMPQLPCASEPASEEESQGAHLVSNCNVIKDDFELLILLPAPQMLELHSQLKGNSICNILSSLHRCQGPCRWGG